MTGQLTWLVPLPVLLPLLGAGTALVLSQRPRAQRAVSVLTLTAVLVVSAALAYVTDREGPQVMWIGGWRDLGISLVADRLSALMLLVSALVALAVLVFSIGQGLTGDERETPVSIYHPTYLVLAAGVANSFLAGDLFNLFVAFEMLLFASFVLLTLGGTEARIRAGTIYVVVNVLSSMLFLVSIALVYGATGTVNLAQLAGRMDVVPGGVALMLQLVLLVTFAIKAAVFPLSFWLPDSYPTAPAPVTAVFAGLLTKVGVYAIIRTQTLLFPDTGTGDLLLWAAILTMLVGILGAVAQSDVKRMLSFTLVSHIGYMVLGIALGTREGLSGAIFYVAHHITIQTALFLVLGLIERRAGSTSLLKLGGLARLAPLLGVLFFVPAMNLAGIPPLSGFLGKVGLLSAAADVGTPLALLALGAGLATSLLTLYAVAKVWNLAFWRTPEQAHETLLQIAEQTGGGAEGERIVRHRDHVHVGSTSVDAATVREAQAHLREEGSEADLLELLEQDVLERRLPLSMVGSAASLVVVSVLLTVVAGPLFAYTDAAAENLLDQAVYVDAVLGVGR